MLSSRMLTPSHGQNLVDSHGHEPQILIKVALFRQHAKTFQEDGPQVLLMETVPSSAMQEWVPAMVALGQWCVVALDFGKEAMWMEPQSPARPMMDQPCIMLSSRMITPSHGQSSADSPGRGQVQVRARRHLQLRPPHHLQVRAPPVRHRTRIARARILATWPQAAMMIVVRLAQPTRVVELSFTWTEAATQGAG